MGNSPQQDPEQMLSSMDPMRVSALLRSRRDRLAKLPEKSRDKVLGYIFRKFYGQKLAGLSSDDMQKAQQQWQRGILGQRQKTLPSDFGAVAPQPPGLGTKASALGAGALSSAYGMAANVLRGYRKLPGEGPPTTGVNKFLDEAVKEYEQKWGHYKQLSEQVSPTASKIGQVAGGAAVSLPAFEAGGEAVPEALARIKYLGPALKGALSGAAGAPLYSSDPKQIKSFAEWGAALGVVGDKVFGGLASRKTARLARRAAKAAAKVEARTGVAKPVEQKINDVEQLSQGLFGKKLEDLTPTEHQKVSEEIYKRSQTEQKAAKGTIKVTAPVEKPDLATKEGRISKSKESNAWRRQQYIKLRKLGLDTSKGSHIYKAVSEEGRSADDIVSAMNVATRMAAEDTPEVKSAISAVAKTAPEGVEVTPKTPEPAEAKPPEPITTKPPEKEGHPPVKVFAPGVGATGERKQWLDRLDDLTEKRDAAASPLARARIQKSIDNVKAAMTGDKEAAERVRNAEALAHKRETAAVELPAAKTGVTEEGEAVPTTETKTPSVEMIDSLKALDNPIAKRAYTELEKARKSGMDEDTLRSVTHQVYQQLAKKAGVEDWDTLDTEDLYNRVTAIEGGKIAAPKIPDSVKQALPFVGAGAAAYGASKLAGKSKDDRIREAGVGLGALAAWAATRGKIDDPEVNRFAVRGFSELMNQLGPHLTEGDLFHYPGEKYASASEAMNKALKTLPEIKSLVRSIRAYVGNPHVIGNLSEHFIANPNAPVDTETARGVKALVSAIRESHPDVVRLYRGEYPGDVDFVERKLQLKNLKAGDDFNFPRLTSFSDSKVNAEGFAGRRAEPAHDEHFVFETVGPIKRLNIAPQSTFREQESLTFGKFRVEKVSREAGTKQHPPITRIHIRQEGVD